MISVPAFGLSSVATYHRGPHVSEESHAGTEIIPRLRCTATCRSNLKWWVLRSTYLHSGWEFAEEGWIGDKAHVGAIRPSWLPAQVPGHVHLDLIENGVIADPFVRMNELGCQWVDEKAWIYRTSFHFHPDEALPSRVLRFEGLDTIATISLNGEEIGRSDNMFVPLELDVTDKLLDGSNKLQVRFESA